MPKRPTPCPSRKSVNSQEELIAKNLFFPALRAESLCFFLVQPCPRNLQRPPVFVSSQNAFFSALRAESSPMQAFPIMCPCLKPFFFPALRAVYVFSLDASFLTNKMALPGLPHKQICSTWSPPRRELLYQGFPANRSCLPELPHEQNYSTWVSPRTELSAANLLVEVILFVGEPK